jgi:sugar phosphate isomerase/epimerase
MDSLAFVIHPIEPQRDVALKHPLLGRLPPAIIDYFSRFFPPVRLSHIVGICSEATSKGIEGWLIACPFDRVNEIARLASLHGVRLSGFQSFERVLTDDRIARAREIARLACA